MAQLPVVVSECCNAGKLGGLEYARKALCGDAYSHNYVGGPWPS
jgi:hypothetical protein